MGVITITRLYDLLSDKVGKETAENLINFIEQKITSELENRTQILATKADVAEAKAETQKVKAELIKWMFIFWIGQVVATFGFILLFLNK